MTCTYNICTLIDLSKVIGFLWDKGNIDKSYEKHGISSNEAEEIFLDKNLLLEEDIKHSQRETRFVAIGKSESKKVLFVVLTLRVDKIRIISARLASKKERKIYEKKT